MKLAIKTFFATLILLVCILLVLSRTSDKITTIKIEAIVQKDDVFQIFYLKEGEDTYTENLSIREIVSGSRNKQIVSFELPSEINNLRRLRIDLGQNEDQKEIKLFSISLIKNNKKTTYKKGQIFKKFTPNNFISLNKDNETLSLSSINKIYDPFLVSVDLNELNGDNKLLTKISLKLITFTCLAFFVVVCYYYRKELYSFSLSMLFLIVLLVPFLWSLKMEGNETLEKRELTEKPVFNLKEIKEYPKKFEAYFNDNFGFRSTLIAWGSMFKLKYFKSSINLDKVALGKDNWLFLSGNYNNIVNDFSRRNLYSQEQLTATVDKWESKARDLASRNIGYYKAFWPNKHTIYPEKLPFGIRVQPTDTVSRMDQIINYLRESGSPIKLIDAREELKKKKKEVQLYYKLDSHWNDYGAFIATTKLINEIAKAYPEVEPLAISDFRIDWTTIYRGDLTNMLGIKESKDYKDNKPDFIPLNEKNEFNKLPIDGFPAQTVITQNEKCSNDLTILIFRDSFTTSMVKFISPRFKNCIYIWSDYNPTIVEKVKPNIVMEAYVERLIR